MMLALIEPVIGWAVPLLGGLLAVVAAVFVGERRGARKERDRQRVRELESYVETTESIDAAVAAAGASDPDDWLRDFADRNKR